MVLSDAVILPIYPFYKICSEGRVYSLLSDKYLKHGLAGAGYPHVNIKNMDQVFKSCYVHRLVAEAFLSNWDPCLDVNHKDGNKKNNNIENLEMVTKSQNTIHGYENNLLHKGSKHYNSRISIDEARLIKYGFPTLTHKQVADIFDYKINGIWKIRQNLTWRGI